MGANTALRAVRRTRLMSQDDLARALRAAGAEGASKRHVQRWESGAVACPRPVYLRALVATLGLPAASLGFRLPVPGGQGDTVGVTLPSTQPAPGGFGGVWLSRYEFASSTRGATFASTHYVLLDHVGDRITVRSLPKSSDGELTMDLTVDGVAVTGTWSERTEPGGYYRGARYHGAVQLLVDPTGRRMTGLWVGFGSNAKVKTGPWELLWQDSSTSKATLEEYNRRPAE